MPVVTAPITSLGPVIDIWASVSVQRFTALTAAGASLPEPRHLRGLLDTGATETCVDSSVVQQLGLAPTGMTQIHTPTTGGCPHNRPQYDISLWIAAGEQSAHNVKHTIPVIATELSVLGIDALIGRDVLDGWVLFYNGPGRILTLTF